MQLMPITPTGKGPVDRFSGDVYVTPISSPSAPSYLAAAIVHFTPGARTNWHVHPNGLTLHRHGAAPDTLAVHIAIVVASSDDDGTDWLEPVGEETYLATT